MKDSCNTCRYWLLPIGEKAPTEGDGTWGWCRRFPPTVSDHMASITIGFPQFSQQSDPEDLATPYSVSEASLFPAIFSDKWCGEFARATEVAS